MSQYKKAMNPVERIQENLLATNERRLLNWLCARLPAWVMPDQLTVLGFFGALVVGAGYALSSFGTYFLLLVIAGFCINWFGDSLDGSLARFRSIERPRYGYFIDHSADSLANMLWIIGLGLSPFVRLDVALFGLAGYLLMSIHTFLAARVMGEFRLSYMAGGPTELRLMLIVMTCIMMALGPKASFLAGFSVFDIFLAGVGVVLVTLFTIQTAATARKLLALMEDKGGPQTN